ncbi:hypothetical protein IEQ34_001303 [Dendrobium chrysotoxum]|uniref:WIYLD domain-containing protein n=1 Tax=Dendrobium chrysotoxum TaxID=161865 RepID=A0AAV7HR56_DENCH|nr:hypothetical protein IEQ34_001303 [Dendrobium chrysotoxum]
MDAAIAALTSLGFSEDDIRDTIYEILQAYDNDAVIAWRFIREYNYKMVVNMLEYKRMKQNQAKSKHDKKYAPYNAEEFNYTPTKCYGMNSDEEDDED